MQTLLVLSTLLAASTAAPFISFFSPLAIPSYPQPRSLGSSAILPNPLQLIHSKILQPSPVVVRSPPPVAAFTLDSVLQAKLNLLLSHVYSAQHPQPRPVSLPATTPAVSGVIPLASTKPFKPEHDADSSSSDDSSSASLAVPSRPSESQSGSASVLLTSYGVPAAAADVSAVSYDALTLPLTVGPRSFADPGTFGAGFVADEVAEDVHKATGTVAQVHVSDDQQQYISSYELTDGTKVREQGRFMPTGNGAEVAYVKEGRFEYVSPEGTPVLVNWVADQNGYRVLDA